VLAGFNERNKQMLSLLAQNWWMLALRGVAAILFGIVAISWPDITIRMLVSLFGAYAFIDGVFSAGAAIGGDTRDRWFYVFRGVSGIIVAGIALVWPGLTALSLLYFIAAWAVVTGVTEVVAAIQFRDAISGEALIIISGLLSIVFGTVLFAFPGDGAIAVVVTIGILAIINGTWDIIAGFSLHGWMSERLRPVGAGR
jgi:uncharacterized membrane protein HdeD (DUF308 family)